MHHGSVINLSLYIVFILLGVSAFLLFKDIRSGKLVHHEIHFFSASYLHDKKPCNKVKVDGCIPDPLGMFYEIVGISNNVQAAESGTKEVQESAESNTQKIQTTEQPVTEKPRFP